MLSNLLQAYHETHKSEILFQNSGIARKGGHVQRVRDFFIKFPQHFITDEMDPELAIIVAEHHDDGRLLQYQTIGKLDDRIFSHSDAGVQMLSDFCQQNGTSLNVAPEDIQILRDVMLYHSKLEIPQTSNIHPKSLPYIQAVATADSLENGTMSCVNYFRINYYEKQHDYSYEHNISSEVWEFYSKGIKFDRFKYVKTWDEYCILVATLATNSIKEFGELAKQLLMQPGFGYPSILEGFRSIFYEFLLEEDACKAYKILQQYMMQ